MNVYGAFSKDLAQITTFGPHDGFKLQSRLLRHSEENWIKGLLKKINYLHKTTAKEKTIKERKSLFF